jgi:uncharacterized protein (DUF58 family)
VSAPSFAFDGVVRLTRVGVGYLTFALVIGFAALNTGNNSLYIGLAFMLGGLIASGVASRNGLRDFRLAIEIPGEAWAGVPAEARLEMKSESRFWSVRDIVIVSDLLPRPLLVPRVDRKQTAVVQLPLVFPRRGRASIQSVDLYTRYPFGLLLKKKRAKLGGSVIVYPRLLEHPPERRIAGSRSVDLLPRRRLGSGSDIHGFREYVRGDNLRHVHWKKSAGLGRWIMKQHEEETTPSVIVAIDPVRPASSSEEAFEEMISSATTLLKDAIDDDLDVALILPATRIRGRGVKVRRAIFEALATVEAERWGDFPLVPKGAVLFSLRSGHESKSA